MLRIVQNRAAASAKSYYSHGDYYAEGQELAGRWRGKGAERLGLSGLVEKGDFDAMCDNRDPGSGQPLTVRTKADRTVGYDFNFHVPKGVSLAYALGRDERILDAFRDSVDKTMADMEREAKTRVRIKGQQENRETGNLVWAEFIHTTARPVNGLPDPHLHAHCFVFNTTFDPVEERWKAAQFRELKRDAPYFEALFHTRLARRMREIGYTVERHGRNWDISEVPEAARAKFARRTDQIEELAREKGIIDPDEKAELGAKSREAKQSKLSFDELREQWLARIPKDEADWLNRDISSEPPAALENDPDAARHAMRQAVSHCFERESVVPQRTLLAEALRRGVGHVMPDELLAEQKRQGVIAREFDGRMLATTKEVIAEERAVLNFVRQGRGQAQPLNREWNIRRDWLSDEQRHAVKQLLKSRDRVQILRGGARTGKTSLMQETVEAIEAGGHQVMTFAPSAQASRGVLRSEGFANATTVAELLVNTDLQAAAQGQVLWIDEAGLLGTRQLKQVVDLAERSNSRLILAGDWKQHGSVTRGGMLRLLESEGGLAPVQLSSVRRQQGQYKEAVSALVSGKLLQGFQQLDRLGWVHEMDDAEQRDARIARDYADGVASGDSVLVVSPTHAEAKHLTSAIRGELRERGVLSEKSQLITRLEPLHRTESERFDESFYQPGDVIVFHQNAPGHRKGERFLVTGRPPEVILRHANRFSVYRTDSLAVAPGELIRVTSNGKTQDGKHRLNNGALYRVEQVSESGDLRLSNGWTIDRSFGHLAHGYVTTSHSSQGKTVDRVLIAESAESFNAASREQFYVSASRGRKRLDLYTDDKALLQQVIQESSQKITASELWSRSKQREQRRRHQMAYDATRQSAMTPIRPPEREMAHER